MELLVAEDFEPRFFSGGLTRWYLPLFHEFVAQEKPRLIVTVGLGDAQAHFIFCQTVAEKRIPSRCLAIRREQKEESGSDDPAWLFVQSTTANLYSDISELLAADPIIAAQSVADRSVDLLLIDDVDAGEAFRHEIEAWRPKLSEHALVLVHGINLERADLLRNAWDRLEGAKAEFDEGIGLGVAAFGGAIKHSPLREALFRDPAAAARDCRIAAELMNARIRARRAEEQACSLSVRQIWFDTLVHDRERAQVVMETLQSQRTNLQKRFAILQKDRAKAQLVIDSQGAQLQNMAASLDAAREKAEELKRVVDNAKKACGRRRRCFNVSKDGKVKRSVPEKITREIKRMPRKARQFFSILSRQPLPAADGVHAPPEKRYAQWIAAHEPDAVALQAQEAESAAWSVRPKISLLIPVVDTPPAFLNELLASVVAQTYSNWEACIVDGGSRRRGTIAALNRWRKKDARFRVERLARNMGISENSNRALQMATGDFIALVDHDDRIASFAMYELVFAIRRHAEAEVFYSDEDRLMPSGARAKPFFKPEWSPELLYSFMYIGHLTAYRRDFALELGGFRKEFDLSQDYDFALRATERAREILHIPHILYHWREHPSSGASGGKPEARRSNIAALADAVRRRGLDADVLELPTANRVRMRLPKPPGVSVVIPTDSPLRAETCARDLPGATAYAEVEFIIVTNTALIEQLQSSTEPIARTVRLVPFDGPFNFSAKCNAGARAAAGERLIFFNDDVVTEQPDWIENVIEPLENVDVGAVAPKLLYTSGQIQHAGLVTGVRGLVGTALHQWPADSVDYTNYAQSMRTVSALSAACLAVRREDFFRVGCFDEINTPIAHSDFDFCFKIREAGMRCVYTPFATLTHRGHISLGAEEDRREVGMAQDKSSVFLLQRWAGFTCHDPFFPGHMREWLYRDSPTPISMFAAANDSGRRWRRDLLLVSHELGLSGAPLIAAQLARWCRARGIFVVVMSPSDGPVRQMLEEAQIPVIIDPLLATGYETFMKFGRGAPVHSHASFTDFARGFDCVVANTIFAAPLVRDAHMEGIRNIWWIHEGLVGDHFLNKFPRLTTIFEFADLIVTPNEGSRLIYQPYANHSIAVLPYGIPDWAPESLSNGAGRNKRLRFLLLGTVERRKGQDTFVQALGHLPREIREQCEFIIVGRAHEAEVADEVKAAADAHILFREAVSHEQAIALIQESDVMVCTSRDETGPLTLIEGMAAGKAILSTRVGVVSEKLVPGEDALFIEPGDADGLARNIVRLVSEPELLARLARNSRRGYDKYFSLDRFGKEFVELFERTIASSQQVTEVLDFAESATR